MVYFDFFPLSTVTMDLKAYQMRRFQYTILHSLFLEILKSNILYVVRPESVIFCDLSIEPSLKTHISDFQTRNRAHP